MKALAPLLCFLHLLVSAPARADIYRWDNGEVIPGTEGIDPGPRMQLDRSELPFAALAQLDLRDSALTRTNLTNALLDFSILTNCNLSQSSLRNASLVHTNFSYCELVDANLVGASARNAIFRHARMDYADFQNADLRDATITDAWLDRTDLSESQLDSATLSRSVAYGATLANANMRGINARNALFLVSDLTNADLSGASLRGTRFYVSTLQNANLTDADVRYSSFEFDISKAQLYSTASYKNHDLRGIRLATDLRGVDFTNQNLTGASFIGHSMSGEVWADLENADFTGAVVRKADLSVPSFTVEKLYSTQSYQERDLRGIRLFVGKVGPTAPWDFRAQDLTSAVIWCPAGVCDYSDAVINDAWLYLTKEQLYSTASYKNRDLRGIRLKYTDLSGWDFTGQVLENAIFQTTKLIGANFTNSVINGAYFESGLSESQLYSTASYQAGDLSRLTLTFYDLTGWNFSRQRLVNANLQGSTLTGANFKGADLTGADLRGAIDVDFSGVTSTRNALLPDDTIRPLNLQSSDKLIISDSWSGSIGGLPIRVMESANILDGTLTRILDGGVDWTSTITFEPGIPVVLGGELELQFGRDTIDARSRLDLGNLQYSTYRLFDWSGVFPTGRFKVVSPYEWDISNLYTTGEVRLVGVPEPSSMVLSIASITCVVAFAIRRAN